MNTESYIIFGGVNQCTRAGCRAALLWTKTEIKMQYLYVHKIYYETL